jgi:N-terminal acetyltransferase B complex non-catalytic subunit
VHLRYKDEVEAEVEAHLEPNSGVDKSWKRNAALAMVRFGGSGSHILKYLGRFGDTNTAYVDLRQSVQHMDVLLSTLLEEQEVNPIVPIF